MGQRILYIGEFLGFAGGIERYAYQTAVALRGAGLTVDYAGTVPARGEEMFRAGFDRILTLAEALREPYDLAVLHKLCGAAELAAVKSAFGGKLVFLAHDHDVYCPRRHYYTPLGRVNCRRAFAPLRCRLCAMATHPRNWRGAWARGDGAALAALRDQRALVLSEFMRGNLVLNGFAAEKIAVVHPFVETGAAREEASFLPDGVLRVLFLGQLIRGKGCDLLLAALAECGCAYEAVIAGDGNDRAWLESEAQRLGVAAHVRFAGWVTEPERLLETADVLAFPSRWQEPFGLGGLEAMSRGVPVAAFDVGGVREWLRDGDGGRLVPAGDAHALGAALAELSRDRAALAALSRGAVARAAEFSRENYLAAMKELM